MILNCVLSFPEWHIVRLLDNARTTLLGVLEMSVDVRHGDVNVLGDGLRLRRAKRPPLSTEHDDAVACGSETLGEAKRQAQPLDRFSDIFVNQDGNDGGSRCRSIRGHLDAL